MSGHYVLNDKGEPVLEPHLMKWARWFAKADRKVGYTSLGSVDVSTVFLGIDHGFRGERPVLYETMLFGAAPDGLEHYQRRYETRAEAEKGHAETVDLVRQRADKGGGTR